MRRCSARNFVIIQWLMFRDGHQDNIHIGVVSRQFSGKSDKEKQEVLWRLIETSDFSDYEKNKISLLIPYSPEELK